MLTHHVEGVPYAAGRARLSGVTRRRCQALHMGEERMEDMTYVFKSAAAGGLTDRG